MWARVAELMLGAWWLVSPFVFRGTDSVEQFAAVNLLAGSLVVLCSLLSFWSRTGWAHAGTAAIAVAVAMRAYFGWERPGPPAAQNDITTALILVLLAVVPNHANHPPRGWRRGAA